MLATNRAALLPNLDLVIRLCEASCTNAMIAKAITDPNKYEVITATQIG